MSLFRTCLLLLGLYLTAGWAEPSAPQPVKAGDKAAPGKESPKKRKPKFTISKATTYVTGPLRKDGIIDYAAALNKRLSRGVTPENNANVLFWKAFGPHPFGAKMPPEFFKWLGYQPPEHGEYFIDLLPYLKKRFRVDVTKLEDRINSQLEQAAQRPWTIQDYPYIASWLKANTHPLALVLAGTRRSHYYSPLVPALADFQFPCLFSTPLPGVQKCRAFATALAARAMLRVEEGRYADAWHDLLACHRLGRLIARGATLTEAVAGIAVDDVASQADLAYLGRAKLSARQALDRLRDLQQLPPLPSLAELLDRGERFIYLDLTIQVAHTGRSTLPGILGPGPPLDTAIDAVENGLRDRVNWDVALRTLNRWFDRAVTALRVKERRAREKQFEEFETDIKMLAARLGNRKKLAATILSAKARPETQIKILETFLGDFLVLRLMPGWTSVVQAGERAQQTQCNLQVAFALAAYKADHGRYPDKLAALAPKYLPQVPGDLFSGKPLLYRPSAKGYLLYSVGINGEDEQGRSYEDDPPGDDLVVRMPLPALRRP